MDQYPKVPLGKTIKELFICLMNKNQTRFGAFEELKKYAVDEHGQLNSQTRLLCGLGAGVSKWYSGFFFLSVCFNWEFVFKVSWSNFGCYTNGNRQGQIYSWPKFS